MTMTPKLQSGDALLIVDLQKDFCAGGKLPVPDGDSVVAVINDWIAAARSADVPIIASRDWHPLEHCSFASQGGPWPEHCVQDSEGAEFHDDLALPETAVRVSKGCAFDRDAYSAFDSTGLESFLRRRGVRRLWVGGLAEDVCVRQTVLDACGKGFETLLVPEATRPVDPASRSRVEAEMREAGASFAAST
jgi:nicotinamidase/pyrazinamidase